MARITVTDVERMNDTIAQASSPGAGWDLIDELTPTMLERLLDLNGHSDLGRGLGARMALAWEFGLSEADRGDYVPADGQGLCYLGRFEAHSRRPRECRGAGAGRSTTARTGARRTQRERDGRGRVSRPSGHRRMVRAESKMQGVEHDARATVRADQERCGRYPG